MEEAADAGRAGEAGVEAGAAGAAGGVDSELSCFRNGTSVCGSVARWAAAGSVGR